MKKYIILATICLISFQELLGQSCNFNQNAINIDQSCANELNYYLSLFDKTVVARDQIDFKSGCDINANSGKHFDAKLDNATSTQLEYNTSEIPGSGRNLEKSNCIPGSLNGSIDISPTGAATYQLPLEVSPGTHGMQPKLSIVYSSQSGNDLLGYGWHLSGLSSISRVNKSQYYDGSFGGVTLTSNDALALDGARLINTATNIYSPENNPYTKVVYNGTSYAVTTQDGMVMEYGKTPDSRFLAVNGSVPLSWAIDKITDPDGNYIQFLYAGDNTTGEYRISEIKYTGNSNAAMDPYNSVKFYYNKRSDANTIYIAGGAVNQTLLLASIKVFNDDILSKDYEFTYIYNQCSKLNSISLLADGIQYNPTIINWGAPMDYSNPITSCAGANLGWFNIVTPAIGDLNGDGIPDLVPYNGNSVWVTIAKPGGDITIPSGEDPTFTFTYPEIKTYPVMGRHGIRDVQLADINNDGKDELLVSYTSGGYYVDIYTFDLSGKNYTKITTNGSFNKYLYADLTNDGLIDTISISNINTAADADGDGQLELLSMNAGANSTVNVGKYNGTSVTNLFSTNVGNSADVRFGDFNGDGKIDILFKNSSNVWEIDYSTGIGFVMVPAPFTSCSAVNVTDWDNDGKADIITCENGYLNIYISSGNTFSGLMNLVSIGSASCFYFADFDNDGQKKMYYVAGTYKAKLSFASNNNFSHYVKSITDGLNNTTTFTYSTYKDNRQFTTAFPKPEIPLMLLRGPMTLATNMIETNGAAVLSDVTYTFSDGYYHYQGKGFLGFKNVTMTNSVNNIRSGTTYNFTVLTGYYYTWPVSTWMTKNRVNISTTVNTISAKGPNISSKFFMPVIRSNTTTDLTGVSKTTIYEFDNILGRVYQQSLWSKNCYTEINTTFTTVSGNINRPDKVITFSYINNNDFTYTNEYRYDDPNPLHLTSVIHQGLVTDKFIYDKFGNTIGKSIISADGTRSVSSVYDSKGRFVIKSIDPSGYTSTATYRSSDGAKLSESDPNGLTTSYTHTVAGGSYTTTANQPDGNIITSTLGWDGNGNGLYFNKNQVTNGNTVTTYFNSAGLKLKETSLGYKEATRNTIYTYNPDESVKTIQKPGYSVPFSYSYYPDGRLNSLTGPNLNLTYSYSGNVEITTNNISGETKTQTFDDIGKVDSIRGTNGKIDYEYFGSGKIKKIIAAGGVDSMTYDLMGNQLTSTDPDAGTTTFTYNGFGQIITQKDQKNQTITKTYNAAGLLKSETGPGLSISYIYDSTAGKLGLLNSITRDGVTESYDYDNLCRVTTITKTGAGNTFVTSQQYNSKGQLSTIAYPTGLTVEYLYDNIGNLSQINNAANHSKIWSGDTKNDFDQWTNFSTGNDLNTVYTYDANHRLSSIKTGSVSTPTSIQNLRFNFNDKGQLITRNDGSLSESFEYNSQNSLTKATLSGSTSTVVYQVDYLTNGNIDKTTIAGQYSYSPNKPHAVLNVAGISSSGQSGLIVTNSSYSADNKVSMIDNGTYQKLFSYGPDNNRFKVDAYQGGRLQSSKIYDANNEFVLNSNGTIIRGRTFIYAPTGICAVYESNMSDTLKFYYIHTDYLGSWLSITNQAGSLTNHYSYDAWGRPRDPSTWQLMPISITNALADMNNMQPCFDRGYTGHEHMAGFGLINMNGRLYDPYLQRFLSPDNKIQDAQNSQSYNRYSYCLNNPLSYTDPTGYSWWSHFSNWVSNGFDNLGDWLTKNNININVGYNTGSGIFLTGSPYNSATPEGSSSFGFGYNLNTQSFGFVGNYGDFNNFYSPGFGSSGQSFLPAVDYTRVVTETNGGKDENWLPSGFYSDDDNYLSMSSIGNGWLKPGNQTTVPWLNLNASSGNDGSTLPDPTLSSQVTTDVFAIPSLGVETYSKHIFHEGNSHYEIIFDAMLPHEKISTSYKSFLGIMNSGVNGTITYGNSIIRMGTTGNGMLVINLSWPMQNDSRLGTILTINPKPFYYTMESIAYSFENGLFHAHWEIIPATMGFYSGIPALP